MSFDQLFDGSDAHLLPGGGLTGERIVDLWHKNKGVLLPFVRDIEAAVLAEQAKAGPEGMVKQCEWRHCGDEYMPGTWDGECGAKWTFTEDGPVENNMRFCPECGGEVVIAATEKENEKC